MRREDKRGLGEKLMGEVGGVGGSLRCGKRVVAVERRGAGPYARWEA